MHISSHNSSSNNSPYHILGSFSLFLPSLGRRSPWASPRCSTWRCSSWQSCRSSCSINLQHHNPQIISGAARDWSNTHNKWDLANVEHKAIWCHVRCLLRDCDGADHCGHCDRGPDPQSASQGEGKQKWALNWNSSFIQGREGVAVPTYLRKVAQ